MEEPDETPRPRRPPGRSFDKLELGGLHLDADTYSKIIATEPRYDAYNYVTEKNEPRWEDEEKFYSWLIDKEIPRELAEMLYLYAPEVSFMLNFGHILGVADLIEQNDTEYHGNLFDAGFFKLGSGNGDPLVVSLNEESLSQVGFFPISGEWDLPIEGLQKIFVSVSPNLGAYLKATEEKPGCLPFDYWGAKELIKD